MGDSYEDRKRIWEKVGTQVSEWLTTPEGQKVQSFLKTGDTHIEIGSWTELSITYVYALTGNGFAEGTALKTNASIQLELERMEREGDDYKPANRTSLSPTDAVMWSSLCDDGFPPELFRARLKQKLRMAMHQ